MCAVETVQCDVHKPFCLLHFNPSALAKQVFAVHGAAGGLQE